jgi:hypothetical protein
MKINQRDIGTIQFALREAIQTYESLVDAYTVGLKRQKGVVINVVPKENQSAVRQFKRRIRKFHNLLVRLTGG